MLQIGERRHGRAGGELRRMLQWQGRSLWIALRHAIGLHISPPWVGAQGRAKAELQIAGEEELPCWQVFTFAFGIPDGGGEDAK